MSREILELIGEATCRSTNCGWGWQGRDAVTRGHRHAMNTGHRVNLVIDPPMPGRSSGDGDDRE